MAEELLEELLEDLLEDNEDIFYIFGNSNVSNQSVIFAGSGALI